MILPLSCSMAIPDWTLGIHQYGTKFFRPRLWESYTQYLRLEHRLFLFLSSPRHWCAMMILSPFYSRSFATIAVQAPPCSDPDKSVSFWQVIHAHHFLIHWHHFFIHWQPLSLSKKIINSYSIVPAPLEIEPQYYQIPPAITQIRLAFQKLIRYITSEIFEKHWAEVRAIDHYGEYFKEHYEQEKEE